MKHNNYLDEMVWFEGHAPVTPLFVIYMYALHIPYVYLSMQVNAVLVGVEGHPDANNSFQ